MGGVEELAEVGVGEDGIDGEVRVVVFYKVPEGLLRLGFAGAVDGPCARGFVGRGFPGFVDVFLVPGVGVDGEGGVGFETCHRG